MPSNEDRIAALETEVAGLKIAIRELLLRDVPEKAKFDVRAIPRAVKGLDASDPIGG